MKKEIRKHFSLSEEAIQKINEIKEKNQLSSESKTIEFIVNKFNNNDLIQDFLNAFDEKYGNLFTRMRLGVNSADKHNQIIIELLNTLFFVKGINELQSTEKIKVIPLKAAESVVTERITRFREINLEKSKKKNQSNVT